MASMQHHRDTTTSQRGHHFQQAPDHGHWVVVASPGAAHFYRKTERGLERIPDAAVHCSHPFPESKHEKSQFLRHLATWLDRAEREQAFERLVLIAPPETLNSLVSSLRENVRGRLCAAHDRDVAWLADEESEDTLAETMWL